MTPKGMKVWIVWEDDADGSWIRSVHDSEAGANAAADRVARQEWRKARTKYNDMESRRLTGPGYGSGTWRFDPPRRSDWAFDPRSGQYGSEGRGYQAKYEPDEPQRKPFNGKVEDFMPRVEAVKVTAG